MISSDPIHGSSPTPGSSVARSCQHMQGSSDCLLGSSASFAGSYVGRSSDPISGTSPALCGSSSSGVENRFFLDYARRKSCRSRNTSCLSTDVQPLLDTHRNIASGHSDTCVTMPSCDDDTACRSWLRHDDGCRLEHDSCSVQCKDSVTTNNNSYFGQSPGLTGKCEGKHGEKCCYKSGDMSRKIERGDTNVKRIKVTGQVTDTVTAVGLSQLNPSDGTIDNHLVEILVDDTAVVDTIRCHQCGDTIKVSKIEEHLDFHLAVDLQERETIVSNSCKRKSTGGASETKKRRNSVRKATTLHKFFEAI